MHPCGLSLLERKLNVSTEHEECSSTVNQIIHSVANGVWCYVPAAVRTVRSCLQMNRSCAILLKCNSSIIPILQLSTFKYVHRNLMGLRMQRGIPMDRSCFLKISGSCVWNQKIRVCSGYLSLLFFSSWNLYVVKKWLKSIGSPWRHICFFPITNLASWSIIECICISKLWNNMKRRQNKYALNTEYDN